ncbi:MAG: mechanosensitive ion channel [Hydrogenophaga sp.]|uniref:mechanosensitive ion channel family protein n=1 Tax=Hydrogenophaga sp. TaxID=1904254 RepID=UPI001692E3C7|nr:mechanosensitive ion channel family protein [Hydrogenophaga sp.]NIM40413.1 mechanosensitive ion channel [Hydrogenophaga sp.]NIN25320.1 mechanosensitive ion channel [Hydrogenophaga sp.]NIN29887.1 mechanosensitive ion channel [Hydrogenophaga sp.]NIN54359.1 mechanosensitive ion channel [Hydrogenophaga sp.]NIO52898.1 mechanosensitive ion channel [Hydrogenophaga sp.]
MNDNFIAIATGWWEGLGTLATTGLRIVLILIGAWIAIGILQRAVRSLRMRIASRFDDREAAKRAETLGRVIRYLIAVVVSLIAGMLVLGELGVSVAPILGAAGVVGLAVGFGAQSLVKDVITGFFLLLENQIRQGDVVKLGEHAGAVEEVTLRYVQLRDYDGNVHYVPNGEITTVINMSRGFSQAVMDIGVAYREDVDEVMAVMRRVGQQLRQDESFGPRILDDLDIAGVDQWADSAVIIRCRFRTQPLEQWGVRREYMRRLKSAFDAEGIEIPYPHLTVYAGVDRAGKAPAFPLQQVAQH